MIIDCHGHYTTAPSDLTTFRNAQIAALQDPAQTPSRDSLRISDDQIRDSLEKAQLKLQRERGSDVTIFSPRASTMAHHIGTEATSLEWSQINNDRPRGGAVSEELRGRVHAAAVPGGRPRPQRP